MKVYRSGREGRWTAQKQNSKGCMLCIRLFHAKCRISAATSQHFIPVTRHSSRGFNTFLSTWENPTKICKKRAFRWHLLHGPTDGILYPNAHIHPTLVSEPRFKACSLVTYKIGPPPGRGTQCARKMTQMALPSFLARNEGPESRETSCHALF